MQAIFMGTSFRGREAYCAEKGLPLGEGGPKGRMRGDFKCGLLLISFSVTQKDEGDGSKPVSFSLLEKERFLESKEKGAPVWVEWLQIGIRRPVFTPPLRTSTVHRRLRRWNREKSWFYPHFFRRLRRWVSGRGGAAWHSHCLPLRGLTVRWTVRRNDFFLNPWWYGRRP